MPLYDFECGGCGYEFETITKIDERVHCPHCHKEMTRLMPSTHGIAMGVGAYGYYDDNLGCGISTNKQKKEVMRQQGVTEKIGKGWY